jgi:hypothetical protein
LFPLTSEQPYAQLMLQPLNIASNTALMKCFPPAYF